MLGETIIRLQAPGEPGPAGKKIWIADVVCEGEIGPWRKEERDPNVCPEGRKDGKAS